MEAWKNNADTVLKKFKEVVPKATFIAVDCEFSGLMSTKQRTGMSKKIRRHDTPEQRYQLARKFVSDFCLLQLGVSVFTYDPKNSCFVCTTFTLHLFPQTSLRDCDRRFLCQASSMSFLAKHNFNFNKLFTDAIPYLTEEDRTQKLQSMENYKEKRLAQRIKNEQDVRIKASSAADIKFVTEIRKKLDDLVKQHQIDTTRKLTIVKASNFQRLLLYNNITCDYPDLTHEKVQQELGTAVIVSFRNSKKSRDALDRINREKRQAEKIKLLTEQCGLAKFFDVLTASKIPVVVHNGMLDLIHIHQSTIGKVPEAFIDFKKNLRRFTRNIFDTKFMAYNLAAKDERIISTALEDLYKATQEWDGPEVDVEFFKPAQSHDAGYDAQMTGMIFVKLLANTGVLEDKTNLTSRTMVDHESMADYVDNIPLPISITKLNLDPEREDYWKEDFKNVVICQMEEHVMSSVLEGLLGCGTVGENSSLTVTCRGSATIQEALIEARGGDWNRRRLKRKCLELANDCDKIIRMCMLVDHTVLNSENCWFWERPEHMLSPSAKTAIENSKKDKLVELKENGREPLISPLLKRERSKSPENNPRKKPRMGTLDLGLELLKLAKKTDLSKPDQLVLELGLLYDFKEILNIYLAQKGSTTSALAEVIKYCRKKNKQMKSSKQ